jgi:glucose/arabinose dehydrogenase
MRRCIVAAGLLASLLLVSACGSTTSKRSSTALVSIGAGLKGPAGLRARVYATGPATTATATFDARGRLWLAAAGLRTHAHDGVYLVPRAGARAVKVIAGLRDPLGLTWHSGTLYVASLGRVDAFTGFDGTRFSRRRRILDGPVGKGENNNLVQGRAGRLVMGVTASCDHCTPRSRYSGAVVSFRRDGSDLRVVAGHIRAPVGLTYAPGTGDLFVSMNLRDDLGTRTPGDWLGVVRAGQDWGSPGCYGQSGSACSGVPARTAVLEPHAAAGGVAIVSGRLGGGRGTSALVAEWQLGKVERVALTRTGPTYRGSVSPYLTGIKNPLAVTRTRDGSLIVGDWATGKIYRVDAAGS